ncbi:DUF5634 family protein [Mesobacillus maritimus]|uniref:DUF5634 family protein n=1 Tax=Mesobacillus maritimus TaxID=1643336 RepID=UPI00203AA640|nr:DUF5634 family protein [Mesobacillus maritimus]MCM3585458.1 DUF5634 family protein [Mesobacillus maritimus]MCM3669717.1 DUF5634 family protein [Mesobacillus maritimus]
MDFSPREEVLSELQQSFTSYIEKYNLDDIGLFEEQGENQQYHVGYTVKKNGKTYHIHTPYQLNEHGELAALNHEWVAEPDDPNKKDAHSYQDVDSILRTL